MNQGDEMNKEDWERCKAEMEADIDSEHRKAELALQTVICYDKLDPVHSAAEAVLLRYFQ